MTDFDPTRDAALSRLASFVGQAGQDYARLRNFDIAGHPHVSRLSPYISHRVLTEEEVLNAVLAKHSLSAAEKFIQEVCWRTYWKGVLERRPGLWDRYKADLAERLRQIESDSGLRDDWEAACSGRTGIDAFDHWAHELATTGYLHNHARMWFASIWVFTLRLPWVLGADFFLRHLLDGDAASNTLSWRWVAGLQTAGRTYLARPDNIAKYTQGRFRPRDLAPFAAPLDDPNLPPLEPAPVQTGVPDNASAFLLTEDDLSTDWLPAKPSNIGIFLSSAQTEGLNASEVRQRFVQGLVDDTAKRLRDQGLTVTELSGIETLTDWAKEQKSGLIASPHLTVGHVKDAINNSGLTPHEVVRAYDAQGWRAATAGFFKFKAVIPKLIRNLNQPQLI